MQDNFNFEHFSTFTIGKTTRNINELEDYLKEQRKNVKIKTKLNIGDKVKLKGRDYVVTIKHIDYKIPNLGKMDYAGIKEGETNPDLLSVFNQNEIDEIIYQKDGDVDKEEK